jgi:hypothetical protein
MTDRKTIIIEGWQPLMVSRLHVALCDGQELGKRGGCYLLAEYTAYAVYFKLHRLDTRRNTTSNLLMLFPVLQ